MESTEALLPIGLVELGLGLIAMGLLFGGWLSRRARVVPLGDWPAAWAALIGIGALRVAGAPEALEYLGTPVFCGLMLSGAYRFADRPVPRRLFLVSVAAALVLLLLASVGPAPVASFAVLAFSVSTLLLAAAVVYGAVRRRKASVLHRLLPIGLVCVALLGVYDHVVVDRGLESFSLWLAACVPIAANQAVAVFDRLRDRADLIADELERSVSLLQATLESTADGILVVDRAGRYTSHNRLFRTMWGIPDEVMDEGVSDVALRFVKDRLKDPEAFYANVKELYAHPERESFDTLEFEDGRCFERYSRPQRIGDEIHGRVWSFRDVTARKRAEALILRDKEQLEDVVSERTRELVESRDRLRQADRMVAIGTLAAGVAHQINNPIGAILNSAQYALLCEQEPDAMKIFRESLVVNAQEARRCGAIVRGMLQFARAEPVEKVSEDLNLVVRLSLRAVDSYARDRKASVRVDLAEGEIDVSMSPLEMEQVVVNLLRNAIESSDDEVEVRVHTYADAEGAHLEISDNGVGIALQDQARVFDPFFSTRIMEGGTGLGLSVAHGIVADHGGKIEVHSIPAGGTTMRIDLPL